MAKTIYIYTDASSKDTTTLHPQGVKRTVKVGVIVINSNIVDIYYNRKEKFINSHLAEQQAITESVDYVRKKYHSNNIIVYTDAFCNTTTSKSIKKLIKNGFKINYVKGHCPNRDGFKYKFNCLADWISRNGINTWRSYYYRHLLKWKTLSF